jgi:hypothetical protein
MQFFLKLKAIYPNSSNSTPLADYASAPPLTLSLSPPPTPGQIAASQSAPLASNADFLDGIPNAALSFSTPVALSASAQTPWMLSLSAGNLTTGLQGAASAVGAPSGFLNYAVVDDMYMVVQYCAS